MAKSDENSLALLGSKLLQGGGGKLMASTVTGPTRRALSTINKNVNEAPSYSNAVNKRSLSERDAIYDISPKHRPVTRKFAAQLAENKLQILDEEIKKSETVSTEEAERIIIDVDDSDKKEGGNSNEPMLVQHTGAIMEEIDLMEGEGIEMEDKDDEEERVINIDACDEWNPFAVVEYIHTLYAWYKENEKLSCVPRDYMDNQKDLNERMRGILIDWLIEVHYKFELMEETLYLTINVIDRFLAAHKIVRKKLQLVGVTALLLACKLEEVSVPLVEDLILISDKAYTKRELLDMEILIANTLEFKFCVPTPYVFMRRFLKAAQSDKRLEVLSYFIIELCLVEYEMLEYSPSKLAASAIYTAQCTLNGTEEWSKICEFHTGYKEEELMACARKMVGFHYKAGTGKLTGVHRKYNTSEFCYVARIEPAGFLLLRED